LLTVSRIIRCTCLIENLPQKIDIRLWKCIHFTYWIYYQDWRHEQNFEDVKGGNNKIMFHGVFIHFYCISTVTPVVELGHNLFCHSVHILNNHKNDKHSKMQHLSTEVKSIAHFQDRGRSTLILRYGLFSLLKILLWLWRVEPLWKRCSFTLICV
jgi:hypothetical protein